MARGQDSRWDERRQPFSQFYNYGSADTHKESRDNYEDVERGQQELDEWAKAKGYQK